MKQNSQYTPGPWIASGSQILQGGQLKDWKLVIASLPSRSDLQPKLDSAAKNYGERNANARLIAAAPDLLDALENLYSRAFAQLDRSATHDGLENCNALGDARAAIRRATQA